MPKLSPPTVLLVLVVIALSVTGASQTLSAQVVSQAGTPTIETVGQHGGWINAGAISGGHAFIVQANTLNVFDLSTPQFQQVSTLTFDGEIGEAFIEGDRAYLRYAYGARSHIVEVVDISDPLHPALIGSPVMAASGAQVSSLYVTGGLTYLGVDQTSLRIADLTNPSSPVQLGSLDVSILDVEVYGDYTYVPSGIWWGGPTVNTLKVIDVSDPSAPSQVGEVTARAARSVQLSGGKAYVFGIGGMGMSIFDLSDPASPAFLGTYDPTSSI